MSAKPAFGMEGPVIKVSGCPFCREFREAGRNFTIRAAAHPPEPVTLMGVCIDLE